MLIYPDLADDNLAPSSLKQIKWTSNRALQKRQSRNSPYVSDSRPSSPVCVFFASTSCKMRYKKDFFNFPSNVDMKHNEFPH